jgi:hypothetical protein
MRLKDHSEMIIVIAGAVFALGLLVSVARA